VKKIKKCRTKKRGRVAPIYETHSNQRRPKQDLKRILGKRKVPGTLLTL